MKLRNNQLGFSALEIVVVVTVVALVGFLGYTAYDRFQKGRTISDTSQADKQAATASDVGTAPEIKTTSDLDRAEKMLAESDLNSSTDSEKLDGELATFQ